MHEQTACYDPRILGCGRGQVNASQRRRNTKCGRESGFSKDSSNLFDVIAIVSGHVLGETAYGDATAFGVHAVRFPLFLRKPPRGAGDLPRVTDETFAEHRPASGTRNRQTAPTSPDRMRLSQRLGSRSSGGSARWRSIRLPPGARGFRRQTIPRRRRRGELRVVNATDEIGEQVWNLALHRDGIAAFGVGQQPRVVVADVAHGAIVTRIRYSFWDLPVLDRAYGAV